ncbi:TonB-dependent receptor [soil metagenome]
MKRHHVALTCAASVIALSAAPAAAQQMAADGTPQTAAVGEQDGVGDIIVTAQKRSQSVNSVALSITAVNGDALAQRGVRDTSDLVKVVPGLTFTPSPYSAPIYTLRGIGYAESSLAASPAVSVYIDEVPLPFPAEAAAATLDLERVEVLKGPQGTLYGQNSTGGAINFIAAKPTDVFSAGGDLSFGRFASAELGGYVSGPITETLKMRLAVRTLQGGAWQRSNSRDETNGAKDKIMGRLLIEWQPTERFKLLLNINGWRDRSETIARQLVAITPQVPANFVGQNLTLSPLTPRAADWTPGWPFRNDRFAEISARAEYEVSDSVKATSISSYQNFHQNFRSDLDATALRSADYRQTGRINAFTQELRLSGDTGGLTWILGGNYFHASVPNQLFGDLSDYSATQPVPSLPPFDFVGVRLNTRINSYAGFGNLEFKVTPQLTLIGGLRYTQTNLHSRGCTYAVDQNFGDVFTAIQGGLAAAGVKTTPVVPISVGQCASLDANYDPVANNSHLNQHNLSFRTSINYTFDNKALVYASVSRGYKSGNAAIIPASSSTQFDPVSQERVIAYEAGLKLPLFDRRVQLNAAAFYYDYKDKQLRGRVRDPIFFTLEQLVNIPKSRVLGGELEIQAHPIAGLDISVAGTYSDSKVQRFIGFDDDGQQHDFGGSPFPFTPKYQLVSDAQYTFAVGDRRQAFIGGGLTYNSKSGSTFVADDTAPAIVGLYRVDGYALLDARAGIQAVDQSWRLTIWGKNLTNKYYWSSVFNANDEKWRQAGEPATYGLTLAVKFGG